jgi:HK97 family phage portal protein
MGLLQRIFRFGKYRDKSEALATLFWEELFKDSSVESLQAQAAKWESRPEKLADYLNLYTQLTTVYACVFAISSAIAQVPLIFFDMSGAKPKPINRRTYHPLLRLFAKPSPNMSYYDLMETTVSFTELTGNGYWEKVVDQYGHPSAIYALRPDYLEAVPDAKKLIRKWEFNINGKKLYFDPEDIVHFKYFNPLSDIYGLAPTAPANDPAILDLYALKFNKIYFKHGARIGGVIERDRGLGEAGRQRLESELEQRFSGWDRAFRIPILPPGYKFKPIVPTHKDMEFQQQRKMSKLEICQAYGVPPAVIGDFEGSSYASAYEQRRMFYLETIVPKLEKYCAKINIGLIEPSYPHIVAVFDKNSIEALKEEESTKADYVVKLVSNGILTINEAREKYYNLPQVAWGNEWHARKSLRPISMLSEMDLSAQSPPFDTPVQNNGHHGGLLHEFLEELIDQVKKEG